MRVRSCAALVGIWCIGIVAAQAGVATDDEMFEVRRWSAAKFQGVLEPPALEVGIVVRANNDPVQKNARAGKPLQIADSQFRHGLYCHAVSDLLVTLPGPGSMLKAVIGVDSNSNTSPGQGSVVFSVEVAGKEVYRSPLMRE